VRVENLDNGREIEVRVNDRGPFAHNRVIDLSRRAAQLIGMEAAGVARVRVTRIYPEGWEPAERPPPPTPATVVSGPVYIQVAALSDRGRARALAGALADYGRAVLQDAGNGLIRVRLGPFADDEEAETVLARVRRGGYREARIIAAPAS
jgi:rare lipoprotein A